MTACCLFRPAVVAADLPQIDSCTTRGRAGRSRPKNFDSIDWLIWISGWRPKAVARLMVAELATPMMMNVGSGGI